MKEVQLTKGHYGHMINSGQVFSPDDNWIVYDTRNDETHISRTCCIEKVDVRTGEVVKLYSVPVQSIHGPGVGAVAFHPQENKMIFIHGLLNCDEKKPYGFTRRFGAILDEKAPNEISHAEARSIESLIAGALRGGTHAHSWSGDGKWISFTYNDFLMEQLEKSTQGDRKDLRTIGVMAPIRQVKVEAENAENFSGSYFSVLAATVTEKPTPGSDEIERAFDECWIGKDGYVKRDGSRQKRALAFHGNVRTTDTAGHTEIFVSDIPEDISVPAGGKPLAGTPTGRPSVPQGLVQRRLTFTANRKYPGVQGPRSWLRSSPDGASIYFLMKDDQGIVQVYAVPAIGGDIRQVSRLASSVEAQYNISPDGAWIALIADNSIWTLHIKTGESSRLTPRAVETEAPVLAVVWNHQGNSLAYNRYVDAGGEQYLQIFKIDLN